MKKAGFSLVELMVTVSILAIITGIGVVGFTQASRSARNAKRQGDLEQIRSALELYRIEEGEYPQGSFDSVIDQLVEGDYISNPEKITDPRPSPYPQYQYSYGPTTECSVYMLEAQLETNTGPEAYQLCNP